MKAKAVVVLTLLATVGWVVYATAEGLSPTARVQDAVIIFLAGVVVWVTSPAPGTVKDSTRGGIL